MEVDVDTHQVRMIRFLAKVSLLGPIEQRIGCKSMLLTVDTMKRLRRFFNESKSGLVDNMNI